MSKLPFVVNDDTVVARNPLGIGRVDYSKCVGVALNAMGDGCTVAEYRERMAAWHDAHPVKHMAYPSGGSAMSVLRYLVTVNQKAVIVPAEVVAAKAAAAAAAAAAALASSEPSKPSKAARKGKGK